MTSGYHILGGITFDQIESEVMTIHRRVSPWLWALSIAGFGMAIWSKWEIHQMFENYQNMRRALGEKTMSGYHILGTGGESRVDAISSRINPWLPILSLAGLLIAVTNLYLKLREGK